MYHKSVCKICFQLVLLRFVFATLPLRNAWLYLTDMTRVTLFRSRSWSPGRVSSPANNSQQASRTFPSVFRRVKKGMAKNITGSVDDLATLSELNEKIILEELQARYSKDVIYVSSTYRALSLSVYNTTHLMRFSFLVQFVIIFSCSGCWFICNLSIKNYRPMSVIFLSQSTRSSNWIFTTRM